jgi:hypothetical protein
MIEQILTIKAPIKVIDFKEKNYYLIIEDAEGTRHYFHNEHENEYGKFMQGQYDGWSLEPCGDLDLKKN